MILTATSGIRLYPTTFQTSFLNQVFGSCRAFWNDAVASFNDPHICEITPEQMSGTSVVV